jgi:flagellar hook-length control protein FliK
MTTDASLPRFDRGIDLVKAKGRKVSDGGSNADRSSASPTDVDRFDQYLRQATDNGSASSRSLPEARRTTDPFDLAVTNRGSLGDGRQGAMERAEADRLFERSLERSRNDRPDRADRRTSDRSERGIDDRRSAADDRRSVDDREPVRRDRPDNGSVDRADDERSTDRTDRTEPTDDADTDVSGTDDEVEVEAETETEEADVDETDEPIEGEENAGTVAAQGADGEQAGEADGELDPSALSTAAQPLVVDVGDEATEAGVESEVAAVEDGQQANDGDAAASTTDQPELVIDRVEDMVDDESALRPSELAVDTALMAEGSTETEQVVAETVSVEGDGVQAGELATAARAAVATTSSVDDEAEAATDSTVASTTSAEEAEAEAAVADLASTSGTDDGEAAVEQQAGRRVDDTTDGEQQGDVDAEAVQAGADTSTSTSTSDGDGGADSGQQPQQGQVLTARPTTGDAAATRSGNDGVTQIGSTTLGRAVAEAASSAAGAEGADGADIEPIWRQIRRALGSIRNLPNGESQMTIRLRPADLGAVLVRINSTDAGTAVALVAESSAAANQLNQQRQQLINDLEDGGLAGVNVDIGSGAEADGSAAQESDGDQTAGGVAAGVGAVAGAGAELPANFDQRRGRGSSSGLIDVDL